MHDAHDVVHVAVHDRVARAAGAQREGARLADGGLDRDRVHVLRGVVERTSSARRPDLLIMSAWCSTSGLALALLDRGEDLGLVGLGLLLGRCCRRRRRAAKASKGGR